MKAKIGEDIEELKRCADASCHDRPKGAISMNGVCLPPDRAEIGRTAWQYLHTYAANYPEDPVYKDVITSRAFITAFTRMYPCHICKLGFVDILKAHPIANSSTEDLIKWTSIVHNEVNKDIGKSEYPIVLSELMKYKQFA